MPVKKMYLMESNEGSTFSETLTSKQDSVLSDHGSARATDSAGTRSFTVFSGVSIEQLVGHCFILIYLRASDTPS